MSKLTKNYLSFTFLIMLICWGICLICSLGGITLNANKWLYVPYLSGGWSPTIASYLSLKSNCIVNSLSGIYIVHDNIWGNLTAAIILILCSCAFVKEAEKTVQPL